MIEEYIKLKLSMPISVNVAYTGKVKRRKSDSYKSWVELAELELMQQPKYKIKGDKWLFVEYEFYFSLFTKEGKKRIKDVFNYEKVLSDFLADNIEGFEDHKIKSGLVKKTDSKEPYVIIKIKEITY